MSNDEIAMMIGLVSLIVTVAGYYISASAVALAADANRLSEQAVKIATFTHKREIAPTITIQWMVDADGTLLTFQIKNHALGQAKVMSILINQIGEYEVKPDIPIVLLRNQSTSFATKMKIKLNEELVGDYNHMQSIYRNAAMSSLRNSWIVIYYADIIGTPYRTEFEFVALSNMMEGYMVELNPKAQETKHHFKIME